MHIDIIENSPSLARLEDNWNAVYDADDEAQIYLSWQWLSGWLSCIPGPWFILAAKERDAADLPYVGFFPLRLQTTIEKSDVFGDIRMAGNFAADYTGIDLQARGGAQGHSGLCPRHQADELGAPPSRQCQNIRAAVAAADGLLSEGKFPRDQGRQGHQDRRDRQQSLPLRHAAEGLERYLDALSTNTRQKIRRLLKQVEASSEYRITVATPETFDRDLKTLLGFWETKWRARKGGSDG